MIGVVAAYWGFPPVADLGEGQGAAAPWLGKWPKVGPFGPFRVSNSDVML